MALWRVPLRQNISQLATILPYSLSCKSTKMDFQTNKFSPLTNSVADPKGGLLKEDKLFRRYRAGLRVGITSHKQEDQYLRAIFYEVGRVSRGSNDALATYGDAVIPIDASFEMNPVEAASLEGFAKKYTNFTGQWRRVDLSAIVERLAKAVAVCATHGPADSNTLRGGNDYSIVALETLDSPQTASTSSVFIPRTVDAIGSDGTFSVMAAAACGEGATVVTDVIRLNPNTNRPVIPTLTHGAFVAACVDALRVLGANYEASGAGDLFAYAVCRGIHKTVSVVAHTDEGGLFRHLFRAGKFRTPYGGINCNLQNYAALPALNSTDVSAVSAWVDGIALKSAALLAHCDPLVPHDGGYYPTTFVADGLSEVSGTLDAGLSNAQMLGLGRQVASDLHRILPTYTAGLAKLFGMETNSGVAAQHFGAVARNALDDCATPDRHLKSATISPYFWVEPTSLIDENFLDTLAEKQGFGALATAGEQSYRPAFEKCEVKDAKQSATHTYLAIKMRSARTSALVTAFAADPGRLNDLKLLQYDTESVVLPGAMEGATNTRAAHQRAIGLGSYLWSRGQSPIPAPGEFMNIHGTYGVRFNCANWSDDGDVTFSALPSAHEITLDPVMLSTTIPEGIRPGPSNRGERDTRAARTRAAVGLQQAVRRARACGVAASPTMEISDVPPTFSDETAPLPRDVDMAAVRLGNGQGQASGIGGHVGGKDEVQGAEVTPVVHHKPGRGPVVGGVHNTAGVKKGEQLEVISDEPPTFNDKPDDPENVVPGDQTFTGESVRSAPQA